MVKFRKDLKFRIRYLLLCICLIIVTTLTGLQLPDTGGEKELIQQLTLNRIKGIQQYFVEDAASINYGGFDFRQSGYACSRTSIMNGLYLIIGYISPEFDEFYSNPEMLRKIKMHLEFIKSRQHADGSISLDVKSINGSNEVGFTIPGIIETYKRLLNSNVPGKLEIAEVYEQYIKNAARCLQSNFPYTSNHRWTAYCAPLAAINTIFPDSLNTIKINEYLNDGIDIDSDGLYYEELSPKYNHVANWGLIMLADYLNRPEFLKLVARNLNACIYMRQPSGEAETLYSRRQDRGVKKVSWGEYYTFKRMAIEDGNGTFATVADYFLQKMTGNRRGWVEATFIPLIYLFEDSRFQDDTIERSPLPMQYEIALTDFPLWRFRNHNVAATIAADPGGHWYDIVLGKWEGYVRSNHFLSYHHGDAIIDAVKILWAGGVQSFHPEKIEYLSDGRIRLYYFDPGWEHISHFRPAGKQVTNHVEGCTGAEVIITPRKDGRFDIEVEISGWKDVPVNLIFLVREGNQLSLPDGKNQLVSAGNTYTRDSGNYLISGSGGNSILLEGLPASEHSEILKDLRYIEGAAEKRCHNLVVGLFSNTRFAFSIIPLSGR